MYQMLSHLRGSVCVPANRSRSHRSDQYRAALIFSSVMGSLDHSIPPGKSSAHLCIPLSFYFISFVESGSHRPRLHPFVPNLPTSQPCLFFFLCPPLCLCSTIPTSHLSCFCVISLSFFFLLFLPADVSPRRRILNVSRCVWKQANVASDLWEKLTARCVDRHRSGGIVSALGPELARVRGALTVWDL